MPTFATPDLAAHSAALLVAGGGSEAEAQHIADAPVLSNLMGHDSHGVARLPAYGVFVDDETWRQLLETAATLGVQLNSGEPTTSPATAATNA
jgi:hypothetical protein